jgi:hypothetical protein
VIYHCFSVVEEEEGSWTLAYSSLRL